MEYSFASYQIAEMAVEIEKESFKFYQRLAGLSTEQAVKELFLSLAQDERMHENTFAGIAREAKNAGEVYGYSMNIAEMMKIGINKLKEGMVNSAPVDQQIDMHRALGVAINSEVLAVRVYTEISQAYLKRFSNVFEKIITQESLHLKRLQALKQKLGI
jgi:rubrerythrin